MRRKAGGLDNITKIHLEESLRILASGTNKYKYLILGNIDIFNDAIEKNRLAILDEKERYFKNMKQRVGVELISYRNRLVKMLQKKTD